MFQTIIDDIGTRFGLGDKAPALVRTTLAYMTGGATGGLTGFMQKFKDVGLGGTSPPAVGGTNVAPRTIAPEEVETVLGHPNGLIETITSKLDISRSTAIGALSMLIPLLIQRLMPNGVVPTTLPPEVHRFLDPASVTAAPRAPEAVVGLTAYSVTPTAVAAGGLPRWLPWLLVGLIGAGLIAFLMRKPAAVSTTTTATTSTPLASTASAVAQPIPTGAGAVAGTVNGVPTLRVYFDTGKADLASEFGDRVQPLLSYLKGAPNATLAVSGFNDPTGNAALNAALSKRRAEAVAAALTTAGIDKTRIVLEKPAETTGTGATNAESRRVEVNVRQ